MIPNTLNFLTLNAHAAVGYQLQLALDGVQNSLIVGPPGVGKTRTVKRWIDDHRNQQMQQQVHGGAPPKGILYYQTAKAAGPKTVLGDIYHELGMRMVSARSKQSWSPTIFLEQIVAKLKEDNIAMICIDEAQLIEPNNIEHLRQIPDKAAEQQHTVRLVLIGYEALVGRVQETGQLGERFAAVVQFPRFAASEVAPHFAGFHSELEHLKTSLPKKTWDALGRDIFKAAHGSFRRLETIIKEALALAEHHRRALTEQDLRIVIQKLPPLL